MTLAAIFLDYTVINGQIDRLADRAIEAALGLGLSGGGAGATKNDSAALLGLVFGGLVGLILGTSLDHPIFSRRYSSVRLSWALGIRSRDPGGAEDPAARAGP